MSEMAIPEVGAARESTPLRTWRDAVTPTSRASRRRWTAVYALLLTFGGVSEAWPRAVGIGEDQEGEVWLLVVVGLFVLFGMLRRGTRRLTAGDHPPLDERDLLARDRAFRLAYPLLLLVLLVTFVVLLVALPEIRRVVERGPDASVREIDTVRWIDLETLLSLLLWAALWAVYLPTGVLAWREPDSLDPDPARALSEPARDALLACALVAGLALSALGSALGLLLFVGALAALGALDRRAAGQPPVAASTVWWTIAVLVVIAALFALLVLGWGGGSSG